MPLLPRGRSTAPRNSHQGHVQTRLRWRQRCGEGAFRTGSCSAETLARPGLRSGQRRRGRNPVREPPLHSFSRPELAQPLVSPKLSRRFLEADCIGSWPLLPQALGGPRYPSHVDEIVRSAIHLNTVRLYSALCKQRSASEGSTGSAYAAASTSTGYRSRDPTAPRTSPSSWGARGPRSRATRRPCPTAPGRHCTGARSSSGGWNRASRLSPTPS